MSAYIVSRSHILYLVQAGLNLYPPAYPGHRLQWFHQEQWHELPRGDIDRAADVANMLWRECIASVSARYPNESSATLPGPRGEDFVIRPEDFCEVLWNEFVPAQVLKSCACYEYQSCEHDGWEASEAHAVIESLERLAISCLPGYEGAEWGAPLTLQELRAA